MIRTHQGFPVWLVDAHRLTPAVRSLVFEPAGAFDYRAGQTVRLTVETATGLATRRPYSIASAPGALGGARFEIAVSHVENGPTSTALHSLALGAEVTAEGPQGGWLSLDPDERTLRTLLVATGTGLAPFRALVQERMRTEHRAALGVLFGCRTRADILWRDELRQWTLDTSPVRVDVTLSRPDADWSGRTGHVQRHLGTLVRELQPELVLICGLSPMVDEVERLALELGVPQDAIRTEAYDR